MRITKFGHACVRVEHDGVALVIDPGAWTEPEAVDGATAVLITHEHPDHHLLDHLRAAAAPVFTIAAVAELIRADAPVLAERLTVVTPGQEFDTGLPVRAVAELHAVIHPDLPPVPQLRVRRHRRGPLALPPRRRADRPRSAGRRRVRAGVGAVAQGVRGGRLRPCGGCAAQPRHPRSGLLRGRPRDRRRPLRPAAGEGQSYTRLPDGSDL